MKPTGWCSNSREFKLGFSLIELLVVIAIIGILVSLLLPAFDRAKQKSRVIQCLSNLKQIGIGVGMYVHDNSDRFPPSEVAHESGGGGYPTAQIGGRDPRPDVADWISPARLRPLSSYVKVPETFRCPDDHGCLLPARPVVPKMPVVRYKPSCWEIGGCSYIYHVDRGSWALRATRLPQDGILAGNRVSWVPDASRFIMLYEPPARYVFFTNATTSFQHWHYASASLESDCPIDSLKADSRSFISPILFVDGHVASHDFTHVIRDDPGHPYEATKDWMWYKPLKR